MLRDKYKNLIHKALIKDKIDKVLHPVLYKCLSITDHEMTNNLLLQKWNGEKYQIKKKNVYSDDESESDELYRADHDYSDFEDDDYFETEYG